MNKDLVAIFEYLEREKGIKRDIIVKAVEESLVHAARKGPNGYSGLTVKVDPKTGEIDASAEKEVVETVEYPAEEISLEEVQELDLDCEIGDWIKVPIDPEELGRIAAQTARQVIAQKIRVAERDVIYEEYRHRLHEIISGTVKRIVRGRTLIVDLGKVEAILPDRYYPKTETYHVGERIQCLLYEVRDTENGGAELILSRSHPEMVVELFKQEVPELADETIQIKKIVREAGYRTKMAVESTDNKVDPLGACVGVRGTRVKNIIRELNNEKIDIVPFTEDKLELLQNLLNPIQIKKFSMEEDESHISIVVADEDYPVVIGKRGMNARLNGAMIDCELEVKKMSEYESETSLEMSQMALSDDPELDNKLSSIEGINQFVLEALIEAGYDTRRKLLNTTTEELAKKAQISREMAEDILHRVRKTKA